MIQGKLTHPQIISALAAAGHGATVLISDGHYSAATAVGPNASTIFLNLQAGTPTVPQVLDVVLQMVTVEKLTRILPSEDARPCLVHSEIDTLMPEGTKDEFVDRFRFYDLARSADLALCIVTGDSRRFANVLLTLGVLPQT
ncbi:RbsD or FucU transport [Arthrobacter sp. MI7-26]|uniref:RbsD/FucU domain-containing protein n=1 Tax=Arthrobacter sp. MI7-26 TaxID=2993653 RepID=UPI002248F79A|nr:RbsD/FucU domain-containing protein [Arthrobacter sp. MI7-26]MCX2748219.1 RbsD or FucU transport [Arthrobacter sp. MI7-26]